MEEFMSLLLPTNTALLDVFIVDDNATPHTKSPLCDNSSSNRTMSTRSSVSSSSSSRWDSSSQFEDHKIEKRSCNPPKIPRRRSTSSNNKEDLIIECSDESSDDR